MGIQDFSLLEVRETAYKLYERGLIRATPEPIEIEKLMNESSNYINADYWFGLTSSGVEYREEGAKIFSDGPIDWPQAWSEYLSYKDKEKYIDETSKEVCMTALHEHIGDEDWEIDMKTLRHFKIEGFQAKYYKYIPSGHRITFKLKKTTTPR